MVNDTLATAEYIERSEFVLGTVGGRDPEDYFWLVAPYDGTLSVTLDDLTDDLDLRLLDSVGYELAWSGKSGTRGEFITFDVEAGQIYHINVDPFADAVSSYTLSWTLDETWSSDSLTGGDAGDSLYSAAFLSLAGSGTALIEGSAGYQTDDADYYQLVSPGSGTAFISLSGLDDDLDLEVLDGTGRVLDVSAGTGTVSEQIAVPVSMGETYFIHVDALAFSASSYTLSVDMPVSELSVSEAMSVARLYQASLGRSPDSSGLNFWIDVHEGGISKTEIARDFMNSAEFTFMFGSGEFISDDRFVDLLYNNVLARSGESSGTAYWNMVLDSGVSRADVLISFADSAENIAATSYLNGMWEYDGTWYF